MPFQAHLLRTRGRHGYGRFEWELPEPERERERDENGDENGDDDDNNNNVSVDDKGQAVTPAVVFELLFMAVLVAGPGVTFPNFMFGNTALRADRWEYVPLGVHFARAFFDFWSPEYLTTRRQRRLESLLILLDVLVTLAVLLFIVWTGVGVMTPGATEEGTLVFFVLYLGGFATLVRAKLHSDVLNRRLLDSLVAVLLVRSTTFPYSRGGGGDDGGKDNRDFLFMWIANWMCAVVARLSLMWCFSAAINF